MGIRRFERGEHRLFPDGRRLLQACIGNGVQRSDTCVTLKTRLPDDIGEQLLAGLGAREDPELSV